MSDASVSLLATPDIFKQASSEEPPAKRLKLASNSESDAAECDVGDLGPLQWYTLQKLQKVTLNHSPSAPHFEHQERVESGALGDPTKALDLSAPLGSPPHCLDASKEVVLQVPNLSKPLLQQPKETAKTVRSEEPITPPDFLFVEPARVVEESAEVHFDSSQAPKEEETIPPHFSARQLRTKRERGRRHVPGSCIDLTQSDEEGAEGSAGTVEDPPPVQTTREGLRETPAREEAHRWRQLEGKVCKYPQEGDDVMPIHGEELRCLAPGQFLNDTVIEFYIRWLQLNWPRTDLPLESCLFLNSFFYKKLKQLTSAQKVKRHPDGPDFHRLRRWTKGIDLLRKQYIFVPIHDLEHWTLAVVCFPEERALALPGDADVIPTPAILHLDSLGTKHGGHNTSSVTRQLKSYLAWEVLQQLAPPKDAAPAVSAGSQAGTRSHKPLAKARPAFTADQIVVKRVPVPLQQNDYDCGLFLLHSLETFVKFAPATFRLSDLSATLQLGRAWYPADAPSLRRFELLQMLHRMFGIEEELSEVEFVGTQAQATAPSPSTSPKQEVACQTEAVIALRSDELLLAAVANRAEAGHVQPNRPEPSQAPINSGISTLHGLGGLRRSLPKSLGAHSVPSVVPAPEGPVTKSSKAPGKEQARDSGPASNRQEADSEPVCSEREAKRGAQVAKECGNEAVQGSSDHKVRAYKEEGKLSIATDKSVESGGIAVGSMLDRSSEEARLSLEMGRKRGLHENTQPVLSIVPSKSDAQRQDAGQDLTEVLLSSAALQDTCILRADAKIEEPACTAGSELEAASLLGPCTEGLELKPVDIVHANAALEVASLSSPEDRDIGQHREADTGTESAVCDGEALGSIRTVAGPLVLRKRQVTGMTETRAGSSGLHAELEEIVQRSQQSHLDQLLAAKHGEEGEAKKSRSKGSETISSSGGVLLEEVRQGHSNDEVYFDALLAFDPSSSQPDLRASADHGLLGVEGTRESGHDTRYDALKGSEGDDSDGEGDIDADFLGALALIRKWY